MSNLQTQISELLGRLPENQRQAAADLLVQYGPKFFEIAGEDAWQVRLT